MHTYIHFFAYRYHNKTWVCKRAPFGGTSTPAFANLLAGITALLLAARHVVSVFVTDDSLYHGKSLLECMEVLKQAMQVLEYLGWIANPSKIEGPAQLLVFLGILIDTVNQTLGVTSARLAALIDRLDALLSAILLTVRDVLSMAGRLQWVAAVFPQGRPYIASLYLDARGGNDEPCILSELSRADLAWWRGHLQQLLNAAEGGRSLAAWMRYSYSPIPTPIRVFSDASGDMSLGFGLIYNGIVTRGKWVHPQHTSSAYLEYIPLAHLLREHGEQLAGATIICHTDNVANAIAITRASTLAQSCRDMFRYVYTTATAHDITLLGDFCPREFLALADAVSKHKVNV
eukprot:56439-Eustigmatos_ZCMA.PRE.1